ncbi:MAG TPA: sulfite exporter TauE/SafE family protein [Nitrospirae bacterium]|nr:sulfite exporter TauE/SafE family protein [Nitrospirota bacterium]
MKRTWLSLIIALTATIFMMYQNGAFAQKPTETKAEPVKSEAKQDAKKDAKPEEKKAEEAKPAEAQSITIEIDKTSLNNGGSINVKGMAPAGKPVYLEVWAEPKVRASRFDAEIDKETGKRPYIFYITEEMPAYYKIFTPKDKKEAYEQNKKEGAKWSVSKALKDTGADVAYSVPAKIKIDRYQATLMGSVIGSRGELLTQMDEKENRRRSMQLTKARFRNIDKVLSPDVEVNPDGSYKATIKIREGLAPGKYFIVAVSDKNVKTKPITFENNISFPTMYLSNAGTSLNVMWPFLLVLGIATFGVLMGAGGGFIINPLLVSIWPLPHTVVAGTVMPTVLFSQGSGILNYSRIKFINWKLGCTIGAAMLLGGFIGPKLTEMITLEQFKFVFGWILIILAALMFWQTTPGYIEKNKREQAILKEFQKRAKESVAKKEN